VVSGGTEKERRIGVIAVGRGFSGGHESCCPKHSVQRPGIGPVIVRGRAFEGGSFPGDSLEMNRVLASECLTWYWKINAKRLGE
jgi:hypothetical protein